MADKKKSEDKKQAGQGDLKRILDQLRQLEEENGRLQKEVETRRKERARLIQDLRNQHKRAGERVKRLDARLQAGAEKLKQLQQLVARLRTWTEPMRFAASTTPGHAAASSASSFNAVQGVAAPIAKPSPWRRTPDSFSMRLRSMIADGSSRSERNCTIRSVPPASGIARGSTASKAIASSSVFGAWKASVAIILP